MRNETKAIISRDCCEESKIEKLFTKKDLKAFGEFCRDNEKQKMIEEFKDFYNEFDLSSHCSKDDKLFKRLWNKYFKTEVEK